MKKFEELLMENNIKQPKKFGKKRFEKYWNRARLKYENYASNIQKLEADWEEKREELKKDWGVPFPTLSELVPVCNLIFKNPREAEVLISQANEQIKKVDTFNLRKNLINKAREEWVMKIISEAPEDCKLVVIKGCHLTQYGDNTVKFYESVEKGEPACIALTGMLGFSIRWIAFKTDEALEELYIQDWAIEKNSSTVEYVL